jgi:thiamine biosynthesis protein ThiS
MIRVNDKWNITWHEGMTVNDILSACDFTHPHIAVSINGRLVPPDEYPARLVADGDKVHVIHIIGGG